MLVEPLGSSPCARHREAAGTDLVLGFEPDALRLQAAVIDPRVDIQFGQPLLTCSAQLRARMSSSVRFQSRTLAPNPSLADLARGQHHMGVRLGSPSAPISQCIEIGDHAAIDELALDEVARQPDALGLVQLARNGELDLAGQLGVLAQLGRLDRIPQLFAVVPLARARHPAASPRNGRRRLVREVVMAIEPLIVCSREAER
jgi:hypothetical protein